MVFQQKLLVLLLFLLVISQLFILGFELGFFFLNFIKLLLLALLIILFLLPDLQELLVHFDFQILGDFDYSKSLFPKILAWW